MLERGEGELDPRSNPDNVFGVFYERCPDSDSWHQPQILYVCKAPAKNQIHTGSSNVKMIEAWLVINYVHFLMAALFIMVALCIILKVWLEGIASTKGAQGDLEQRERQIPNCRWRNSRSFMKYCSPFGQKKVSSAVRSEWVFSFSTWVCEEKNGSRLNMAHRSRYRGWLSVHTALWAPYIWCGRNEFD